MNSIASNNIGKGYEVVLYVNPDSRNEVFGAEYMEGVEEGVDDRATFAGLGVFLGSKDTN